MKGQHEIEKLSTALPFITEIGGRVEWDRHVIARAGDFASMSFGYCNQSRSLNAWTTNSNANPRRVSSPK